MDARDNRPPDICLYEFCVAELYHVERNHQGKDNVLLFTKATRAMDRVDGSVGCKERLGGLLQILPSGSWGTAIPGRKCSFGNG